MPFLVVRGLGALPALPTKQGELLPNRQWVRYYEVDTQHQLKQCPPNAPFGCWLENGYAWGQREWYPDEFSPRGFVLKPLPAPFPHPVPATTAPKPKPVHHAKKKKAAPPSYQQPFISPLPTPTPPPTPSVTMVTQPPSAPVEQPAPLTPVPHQARSGVLGVVGVGLFIAIGLTLLR